MPLWKRTKTETQSYLLAKPMPLKINLGGDRFSMFNNERDIFVPQRSARAFPYTRQSMR